MVSSSCPPRTPSASSAASARPRARASAPQLPGNSIARRLPHPCGGCHPSRRPHLLRGLHHRRGAQGDRRRGQAPSISRWCSTRWTSSPRNPACTSSRTAPRCRAHLHQNRRGHRRTPAQRCTRWCSTRVLRLNLHLPTEPPRPPRTPPMREGKVLSEEYERKTSPSSSASCPSASPPGSRSLQPRVRVPHCRRDRISPDLLPTSYLLPLTIPSHAPHRQLGITTKRNTSSPSPCRLSPDVIGFEGKPVVVEL